MWVAELQLAPTLTLHRNVSMNIYSPTEADSWWVDSLRKFFIDNQNLQIDGTTQTPVKPAYTPILYGEDNGFFGKKHTEEQKLAWSRMKKGVPQGPKSEEHKQKLRRPKSNKENYKGSPGKITCINKIGQAIQIETSVYHAQKISGLPMEMWEYVNTRSKEAIKRKNTKIV